MAMKLSATRVDSSVIEQGDWVENIPDLPGIRIKARGTNNSDYRLLEGKLVREIPRTQRAEGVSPSDQDRIAGKLLLETVVLDIEGITEDVSPPSEEWAAVEVAAGRLIKTISPATGQALY